MRFEETLTGQFKMALNMNLRNLRLATTLSAFLIVATVFALSPMQTSALAQSAEWNALYDRIIRLEHRIKAMQSQPQAVTPSAPASGDVQYRLSAMENQLRQVLGRMEQMSREMGQLRNQMRAIQLRNDSGKLQQAPKPAQNQQQAYNQEYTTLQEQPSKPEVIVELEGDPAPGSKILGQVKVQPQQNDNNFSPQAVESASLDDPLNSQSVSTDGAKQLLQSSKKNLVQRRFGLAESGFKSFLKRYRKHALASDAQFFLGETYYSQGLYKRAAQNYLAGYRKYPRGARGDDSLFRLAQSLRKLGQKKQACGVFAQVGQKYPKSSLRKRAAQERKRARC